MTLFLAHGPCSGVSGQSNSVRTHESPGTINETADDFHRAGIEALAGRFLRAFERRLGYLTIAILDPTPVL